MDKVMHFEIPADDLGRAKKFYKEAFGWKLVEYPDMEYTILQTGKTDDKGMLQENAVINGGMMKRGKVKHPVITIVVDDIDKKIKDIESHGGKMFMKKMEVPKMGFSAYIKDSEGNVIGLFQPTGEM